MVAEMKKHLFAMAVVIAAAVTGQEVQASTYATFEEHYDRFAVQAEITVGNLSDHAAERELAEDALREVGTAMTHRAAGLKRIVARFFDEEHGFIRWRSHVGVRTSERLGPRIRLFNDAGLPAEPESLAASWPALVGPPALRLYAHEDSEAVFVDLASFQFIAAAAQWLIEEHGAAAVLDRLGGGIGLESLKRLLGDRYFYADFGRHGIRALMLAHRHQNEIKAWGTAPRPPSTEAPETVQRRVGARLLTWAVDRNDVSRLLTIAKALPAHRAISALVLLSGIMSDAAWQTYQDRLVGALRTIAEAGDLSEGELAYIAPLIGLDQGP